MDEEGAVGEKFVGKRIGIRQGPKIRVIDDCTCCGLNLTVGLHEKFKLHSVDFLAAMLGCALKSCPTEGRPTLKGRTYDLRSAYKQFAVHPADREVLRMGVNIPDSDNCALIGFNSLPFGAVGSVGGIFGEAARLFGIWATLASVFFGALFTMITPYFPGPSWNEAAAGHARPFSTS